MKKPFTRNSALITFLAAFFYAATSFGQTTITTGVLAPNTVCQGGEVEVPFTATGTIPALTTYQAQLSDDAGDFGAAPTVVGSSATSPITATIPAATAPGAAYKIRVVSILAAVIKTEGTESAALKVNAIPDAPVVTAEVIIGQFEPATLTATGTGMLWYAASTGGNGTATKPVPDTETPGKKSYFVSQTVGTCESERAEIVVTVIACVAPAAPTVANVNQQVGDDEKVLTAKGSGLKWYTTKTGGSPLPAAPKTATDKVSTTSYFVSQTVDKCESERAEIVVTVSACAPPDAPVVANVNQQVGDDEKALTATGTGLKWYAAKTGGSPLSGAPKPSTKTIGKTSYFVSQTNASGCESERAEIVVTITACTPPDAPKPTEESFNYTIGDKATQLAATPTTGLLWYTVATGGTGVTTAPTPSTLAAGTTNYYVSRTVNGCESARAEIVVTVSACVPPGAPTVADVNYCLNESPTALTAKGATGNTILWYTAQSGGTSSTTAPVPKTNVAGTFSYFVSQKAPNAKCESERVEIVVTVKSFSLAPTVVAVLNLCQNSTATALTATGTNLTWYTAATGGTALASAPVPLTTTTGTTSYYVSQTTAGRCEGPRAKIDVVIKDTPVAPTVTATNYCVGEKAVALTPTGGVYKWYTVATGGNPLAAGPTPTTTAAGTTSYYLTQSNTYGTLSCESPRAKKDVVVNPTPAALPTLSDVFCQDREDKTYTFPTKAADGNTLQWYTVATGGTATTTTPTAKLNTPGEKTFYVTQLSGKNCESATRVVQKVRIKPLPTLPGIEKPLIEYCQFLPATPLEATPMAKATLNWFGTDASGGTSSDTPPTPSTAEGGTTSYYVGQTLEGCLGDRAKIDVKINTTPTPATTNYLEYCQGEKAPILDATGTILKWYRDANTTEWQGFPYTPFTDKVQDYSFYVTQTGTVNGCESPKEEIKIHIKSLPSASISGNSTIDLGETANINIKFTGDGPWIYILSDGTTDTTDQANHQVPVKPSTTTSYLLTEVSNACGKGIPGGQALVTVKIPTINSGNPSTAEACAGKSFVVPFQQSGDFPAENTFKVQIATENQDSKFFTIPSVATRNSITATFPDTTKGGNYYLRVISSGDNPEFLVKGSVSSITISASPLPVATLSGAQTILVGEKATLKVETTGKAPWTFTLSNGTKDTLITASVSPYTFQIAPLATVTYTISKVTNTCGTGRGAGSARVQVDPILGVEPQQPADWVKVYPTLVQSVCTLEVTGNIKPKQASVEVIDLNGRSIGVKSIQQKTTEVDFSNYPSGLYLIRIQNGNLSTVQRVMKP
ncbi:T9SS type A sorting domain-containing protein [Dyadobacter sp. CY343]|uniref:Ig-like domain-containing protein n=1 Tax=Dyadobacter sp. CY343 TaxID=2907299 RepID=UPI001F1E20F8|nr:T9SS type A sorting domain-containing protein [Dyadobacter sp. CY343]MCE7061931.1 T9SS type A sorting domain-containing protein [Dyadobacter sp. CY343]